MTDHAAEQEMEMEALHAILMDDIEEYDGLHPAAADGRPSWRVAIHPPDDAGGGGSDGGAVTDAADELKLDLVFAHVPLSPGRAAAVPPAQIYTVNTARN